MAATSAGLLVYRLEASAVQVLLGHPGGPFWAKRDAGAWSIPKGEHGPDETPLDAARREFQEELGVAPPDSPVLDLGTTRLKSGKLIRAFAVEGELDPAAIAPGEFEMEWPPKSGRTGRFPEIDRVEWFFLDEARTRLNPAQGVFLDRLGDALPR
ncbi:NUDIX domain-containing protein [Lysobacter korlensis]|uniref:NUDIX domain-containing protein n=1 Tax=Lysobacter korlensis TaxID=553636 RepID=A0ABV6RNP3_9GAMM